MRKDAKLGSQYLRQHQRRRLDIDADAGIEIIKAVSLMLTERQRQYCEPGYTRLQILQT